MISAVSLLQFVPFGMLIGWLARALTRGQGVVGWAPSMLVGTGGALLGGLVGRFVVLVPQEAPAGFVTSLLGAALFVTVHQVLLSPRLQRVRPTRP